MEILSFQCSVSVNNDLGTSGQENNKQMIRTFCAYCVSLRRVAYPHGLLLQLYKKRFLFCIVLQIPLKFHTTCRNCCTSYRQNITPFLKSEDQSLHCTFSMLPQHISRYWGEPFVKGMACRCRAWYGSIFEQIVYYYLKHALDESYTCALKPVKSSSDFWQVVTARRYLSSQLRLQP